MTVDEIRTLVNDSLLDGRDMDDDTFLLFLNHFKDKVEADRPWVKLRNEDSSESITAANTWETTHSLPTRFASPYPVRRGNGLYTALVLVSGTEVVPLEEVQWARRLELQDVSGYFAVDYANDRYIITGSVSKTYTAYWSYIKYSAELSADGDSWVFDSRFHKLLAYGVAAMEKARDYDEVNMANIALYVPEAESVISLMNLWNSNLERAMHNV